VTGQPKLGLTWI